MIRFLDLKVDVVFKEFFGDVTNKEVLENFINHMLDLTGDDVIAFFPAGIGDTNDSMVVRFGPAAGKNDFIGLAVEQVGNLGTSRHYRLLGFVAEPMATRRIAENLF